MLDDPNDPRDETLYRPVGQKYNRRMSEISRTSGAEADNTMDFGLDITRTTYGFEVSGAESYACHTAIGALDGLLDSVIVPIVRGRDNIQLDELLEASESAASDYLHAHEMRRIPWTALYLLSQWRADEANRANQELDLDVERTRGVLADWYALALASYQQAVSGTVTP